MEISSRLTDRERKDGVFLLHTDNADIKVCFVSDEIVRVRASFDHELAEESYVLMTTAWEDRMDALFTGERTRVEPFATQLTEDDSTLTFATGKVTLVVDKDPINFKLLAADGSELYSTLPGNPFVKDANNRVVAYSRMKEDDCFYGFGEKSGLLDKNKTFQRERATDAMGYDAEKMDTLYKHIPFYIRLDRDTHKAVGVFYHNFYESVFNMGCEKSNYWPRYTYFQADGGDLDCFLIGGDTIARIVDNYTRLDVGHVLGVLFVHGVEVGAGVLEAFGVPCKDAALVVLAGIAAGQVEAIDGEALFLDGVDKAQHSVVAVLFQLEIGRASVGKECRSRW